MPLTPEQEARQRIDAALVEAGWIVQNRGEMNLAAGRGVAVREFKMAPGHGFADYMLFVDGQAVGVLEAKPVGYTLSSVELQADKYATGLPAGLNLPVNPLPFLYVSTGVDTRFINGLDPDPKSRRISHLPHIHRPETLSDWVKAETLDRDRVRGASSKRLLADLVSLVRFAMHRDAELAPFGERVRERFEQWTAQQRTAGRDFAPEQVRWLEMIRDHIAASAEMTVEDLDYAPFAREGGHGRAAQVFGEGLGPLLDELNEVLAA